MGVVSEDFVTQLSCGYNEIHLSDSSSSESEEPQAPSNSRKIRQQDRAALNEFCSQASIQNAPEQKLPPRKPAI